MEIPLLTVYWSPNLTGFTVLSAELDARETLRKKEIL